MKYTEDDLKHRYESMETDILSNLYIEGGLTDEAELLLSEVLQKRGIVPEELLPECNKNFTSNELRRKEIELEIEEIKNKLERFKTNKKNNETSTKSSIYKEKNFEKNQKIALILIQL